MRRTANMTMRLSTAIVFGVWAGLLLAVAAVVNAECSPPVIKTVVYEYCNGQLGPRQILVFTNSDTLNNCENTQFTMSLRDNATAVYLCPKTKESFEKIAAQLTNAILVQP